MSVVQPFSLQPFLGQTLIVGTNVSQDIDIAGANIINVFTNVTVTNSGTVTITIQGKDLVSGTYYTILAGSALSTVTTQRLKVGPSISASANSIAQDYLPRTIRIQAVTSTAVPTFTVGLDVAD